MDRKPQFLKAEVTVDKAVTEVDIKELFRINIVHRNTPPVNA